MPAVLERTRCSAVVLRGCAGFKDEGGLLINIRKHGTLADRISWEGVNRKPPPTTNPEHIMRRILNTLFNGPAHTDKATTAPAAVPASTEWDVEDASAEDVLTDEDLNQWILMGVTR